MKSAALALVLLVCCSTPALAAPGDLDSSFGRGGLAHVGPGGIGYGPQLELDPKGRVVVAGSADLDPPSEARMGFGELDFALGRFSAAGRLDRRFARRGSTTLALGGEDSLTALEVGRRGILLGGHSRAFNPVRTYTEGVFALAAFDSLGRPDLSFGGNGWVTLPETVGDWSTVGLVHRLRSGEIAAVGSIDPIDGASWKLAFVHLSASGEPLGTQIVDLIGGDAWPSSFLLDSRGGLLVGGRGSVQRFSLDGVADLGFGTNGVVQVGSTEGGVSAMALQRDGSVIVLYDGDSWDNARLERISPAGVVDRTFGKDGVVRTAEASDMAVDRAGRILVGDRSFQLVRYTPDGVRDPSFKRVRLPRAYRGGAYTDIEVARDGDIVAAGLMTPRPIDPESFAPVVYDFAVARFHGGDDAKPPSIRALGCAGGVLRLRVRDAGGPVRTTVTVDGRRALQEHRQRIRLRLGPGSRRVVIKARDSSDNVARKQLRLRACA